MKKIQQNFSVKIKIRLIISILILIPAIPAKSQGYFVMDTSFYFPELSVGKNFSVFNDTMVITGAFYTVGLNNDTVNHIVRWDGENFHTMGSIGINGDDAISGIEYQGNEIYGGSFSDMGGVPNTRRIGAWDGNQYFSIIDLGTSSPVFFDMTVWHDTLFVGGDNFTANGYQYWGLAAYNGTEWIDVGYLDSPTLALAVYNDQVYAGGSYFTPNLKRYLGGTTWEDVPGYPYGNVFELKVDTINNFLYVAGGFNIVGDTIMTDCVAIWNGFYWEKVGYGNNTTPPGAYALELYRGDVYLGIGTDSIGGVYTGRLARWDGQNWNMIGNYPGFIGGINDLIVYKDELYIGGGSWPGPPMNGTDTLNWGINRWYMPPDTTCKYLKPRVFTENNEDTFFILNDTAQVQFYNNNAYVDTWTWDFGDTGTANIKDPVHKYVLPGTYNVCVTVNDTGCIKTACKEIVVRFPVSKEEIIKEETGFKLYPNPTNDNITIEFQSSFTPALKGESLEIQVIDINGKLIISTSLRSVFLSEVEGKLKQSVDISSLPDGVYFVKIGNQTERFVKE